MRGVRIILVAWLLVLPTGCSALHRHLFGGGPKGRTGTVTVAPATGPPGSAFTLTAAGFRPGERLTFDIESPDHQRFVGPAHTAGADGRAAGAYTPQPTDKPGTYAVKAVGDLGTHADGSLVVTGP
jgi:hypothetical protein